MNLTWALPARSSLLDQWSRQFSGMRPEEVKEVHLGALKYGRESPNHLLVMYDQVDQVVSKASDRIMSNQGKVSDILAQANQELVAALKKIKADASK